MRRHVKTPLVLFLLIFLWPAAARPTRSARAGEAFPATMPKESSSGKTDCRLSSRASPSGS